MKKTLLLIAVAGAMVFTACEDRQMKGLEEVEQPGGSRTDKEPNIVASWFVAHEYACYTEVDSAKKTEISRDFTEEEAQQWTFNEDGTGIFQSWMSADGYRPTHRFSWMMSEEGQILMDFTIIDPPTRTTFTATDIWNVERFTADELVVRTTSHAHTYLGIEAEVDIEYRYTLRRME